MTENSGLTSPVTPGNSHSPGGAHYPPGAVENLKLFQKFEDFMDYFEPIAERFPAYEKPVMIAAIKNCMYRICEKIIRTNSSRNKLSGWYDIDIDLKILQLYVRRARKKGSKYLSKRSYETASKKLLEIGRILGGLIKRGN
jgi:hypothetical protein